METPRPELLGTRYERAFAYLLDVAVITVIGVLLIAVSLVIGIILGLLVALLLQPAFMARAGQHNGQSLGKQAVGLRVMRDDGAPMRLGSAFVRDGVLKILFGIAPLFVADVVSSFLREDRRTLHDRVANTFVARSSERWVSPPSEVLAAPSAPAPESEFSVRA